VGLASANNRLTRRGLRPLATAGEASGLTGEAVDSPSPPCRSAPGPSLTRKRYTPHESQLQTTSVCRACIDPFSGIQPSHASSRRTSQRSLRQQRPSYSCAPRVRPLTRGIVRSAADPTVAQRTWICECVASSRRIDLRTSDSQRRRHAATISNRLRESAADALHRQFTAGSSTSRAASECRNAQ